MNGEKSKRQLSVNLLSENPPKRARTPIDKSERDVTSSNIDDGASPKAEIGSKDIVVNEAQLPFDTCFGVLNFNISYDIKDTELGQIPVELRPNLPVIDLLHTITGQRAGTLASEGILYLMRDYDVTIYGTLLDTKSSNSKSKKKAPFADVAETRDLRAVVYGSFRDQMGIGKLLSKYRLYLQNPTANEYNNNVRFWNPQYLARPDTELPLLSKLALTEGQHSDSNNSSFNLSDNQMDEVMHIFHSEAIVAFSDAITISQSPRLCTTLKKHQLQALEFMVAKETGQNAMQPPLLWKEHIRQDGVKVYRHTITAAVQENTPGPLGGCLLADDMGLGKTLSTLALICHHLDRIEDTPIFGDGELSPNLGKDEIPKTTLIIAPKSTLYEWESQITRHIKTNSLKLCIYHGAGRSKDFDELPRYDIVLTTYGTLCSDITGASKQSLFSYSWARVILDEAHTIRNQSSQRFTATCALSSRYRWCLTGTPIQNRLGDFGALMAFLRVPYLTTKQSFERWIEYPVLKKYTNALQPLRTLIAATSLRRTKADCVSLNLHLPAKTEVIESVDLDNHEREIYDFFRKGSYATAISRSSNTSKGSKMPDLRHTLLLIGILRFICNHSEAFLSNQALKAWNSRDSGLADWTVLGSESDAQQQLCDSCSQKKSQKELDFDSIDSILCSRCLDKSQSQSQGQDLPCTTTTRGSAYTPSSKIRSLLWNIATQIEQSQDEDDGCVLKSVVFSYWTTMLDLIQQSLVELGIQFQRIDGKSSTEQRKNALDSFNTDPECTVMLASIGAVGEGINLTVANTVHIMEPQWNPMTEAQAIDRVHRIGQMRDVKIYRYIATNTIESYVQWKQNYKLQLIRASFSANAEERAGLDDERWKRLLTCLKGDGN